LVFAADDGCLCIDLEWVEAVYQRGDVPVHTVKDANGTSRGFLIHRGQPALVVDPREALGLNDLLGSTERAAFLVLRAGSFLLALPVDAFVGVRDLDLSAPPVPSSLLRDGGLCVGHLVELDGKLHATLEPSRILSPALREKLAPLAREAHAFCERQQRIAALVTEMRREPTLAALRTYARLTRRNGRGRAATAARALVKALQEHEQQLNANETVAGDLAAGTVLRDLVALIAAQQTGVVEVELANGESATIFFDAGRIADATTLGQWGRGAFKRILGSSQGSYRFVPSDTPIHPQRIEDAALWLLVETSEQLSEERRGRHGR
jgi:chemotaxis signal transduction protein